MTPILLFDGECHLCTRIARWVQNSAGRQAGPPAIVVKAIGQDPAALRLLNPNLDIWEAYAAPHVLMPDGSMPRAGYAVAQVFRCLPNTKWFAGLFAIRVFGHQPFQILLNAAYDVLADSRPLLGCGNCGGPRPWVKPLLWVVNCAKSLTGGASKPTVPDFTPLHGSVHRPAGVGSLGRTDTRTAKQ